MLEIRRAVYQDIPDIMQFIGRYYKKNHILARDRKFFEWQYVDRGKVNMYIAIDGNKVYAIEGFVIYNDLDSPDMTGSMWKSIRCEENTMVGIDVDQLLQEEIHLCCLYLTDLPVSYFGCLLGCKRDTVYKKANRIVEKRMGFPHGSTSLQKVLKELCVKTN